MEVNNTIKTGDTVSGNEVIAEFLQLERTEYIWDDGEHAYTMKFPSVFNKLVIPSKMQFHKSWDWFMPAYVSFLHLTDLGGKITEWVDHIQLIQKHILDANLKLAHEKLVEGINWYNTIKQK